MLMELQGSEGDKYVKFRFGMSNTCDIKNRKNFFLQKY